MGVEFLNEKPSGLRYNIPSAVLKIIVCFFITAPAIYERGFFMKKNQVQVIAITGLMIAISIVLSYFNPMIPIAGIPGMRISFSSYISVLPSFLFGPLYGGIAMGITDVLSCVVRGDVIYPPLTITAIAKGALLGAMYMYIKRRDFKIAKYDYVKVLICLLPINVLITTINTKLIMVLYSISKAFIVFYTPRIIEELLNVFIQSYIVCYLLKLSNKLLNK